MRIQVSHDIDVLAERLRSAPAEIVRQVDRQLGRGALEVARDAQRAAPKGLSDLVRSIQTRRLAPMDHEVYVGVSHGEHVERGAKPGGMPPRYALLDWIRIKGIVPRAAKDARGLAFLIGRAIHRRGTKPRPYLEPALDGKRERLRELLAQGVSDGLKELRGV